jgi:hypothetical protein
MATRKKSFLLAVLVFLGLCNSTLIADVSEGLISHWRFDEGSGAIAYDSAGTNDGTIYGADWTTGQVGGALSFDGVDDYVEVIDSDDSLDIEDNITITAWVKLDYFNLHDHDYFVGKQPTGTSRTNYPGNYIFRITPLNGHLVFHHQTGTGTHQISKYSSTYGIVAGEWQHCSVTLVEGGNVNFYIDSSPAGTVPQLATFGLLNDEPVRIGTRKDEWSYFFGLLDEIYIFNRALSAEEIWDIYMSSPPEPRAIDINPGSCPNPLNVKSKGVIPVAILGSEDFDVSSIDAASIRLAGVAPIRSSFEDVGTPLVDANECECSTEGPDGFLDLTLKFETQGIVEVIGEVNHGDELTLELTAVLSDETHIEGSDCVIIRGRHKPLNKADFNGDGIVDMADFAAFSENWLQSSIVEY